MDTCQGNARGHTRERREHPSAGSAGEPGPAGSSGSSGSSDRRRLFRSKTKNPRDGEVRAVLPDPERFGSAENARRRRGNVPAATLRLRCVGCQEKVARRVRGQPARWGGDVARRTERSDANGASSSMKSSDSKARRVAPDDVRPSRHGLALERLGLGTARAVCSCLLVDVMAHADLLFLVRVVRIVAARSTIKPRQARRAAA